MIVAPINLTRLTVYGGAVGGRYSSDNALILRTTYISQSPKHDQLYFACIEARLVQLSL